MDMSRSGKEPISWRETIFLVVRWRNKCRFIPAKMWERRHREFVLVACGWGDGETNMKGTYNSHGGLGFEQCGQSHQTEFLP